MSWIPPLPWLGPLSPGHIAVLYSTPLASLTLDDLGDIAAFVALLVFAGFIGAWLLGLALCGIGRVLAFLFAEIPETARSRHEAAIAAYVEEVARRAREPEGFGDRWLDEDERLQAKTRDSP